MFHLLGLSTVTAAVWTTSSTGLLKDGAPFTVRGFCYEPTIPSHDPSSSAAQDRSYQAKYKAIFDSDFANIKAAGANTVKIYGDAALDLNGVSTLLDSAAANGLSVLVMHWMASYVYPCELLQAGDVNAKNWMYEKAGSNVRAMAASFAGHPALMGYVLGNELNAGNGPATPEYGNCLPEVYKLIGNMTQEIKLIDKNHLVTTAFETGSSGKPGSMRADTIIQQSAANGLAALDFWGMDLYRNGGTVDAAACDFDYGGSKFFTALKAANVGPNQKPLVFLEFGADRFNMNNFSEWPTYQAQCDGQLVTQVEACAKDGSCAGGLVFSWVDEWWKSKFSPDPAQYQCPTSVLDHQTFCGFKDDGSTGFPDSFFNEEYWGVNSVVLNSTGSYCRKAEPAMAVIAQVWGGTAQVGKVTCTTIV